MYIMKAYFPLTDQDTMKSKLRFTIILFVLAMFIPIARSYADSSDSYKTAAAIDANNPADAAKWGRFESYEFSQADVAPYQGDRKILFRNPLEFDFEGLPDGKDCQVRATFLSDSPRVLALDSNGTEFESQLVLEKGVPVTKEWIIPAFRIYSGKLSLTISAVSGPNAVLQKLEVRTVDGKALKPGARKEFKEATDAELEKLVMPLPQLTPRPKTVEGVETPLISLNGTWDFSATGSDDYKPIEVPGEWKMQGFDVAPKAFAGYRKTFTVPADWAGQQVKLRFDAVHAVCEVKINGQPVGGHEGGSIPFELDITKAIKAGVENTVEVRVQSESTTDSVSCISQYAAHQVGGIIRKVTLFAVPSTYIASDRKWTTLDASYKNAVLHYDAEIRNVGEGAKQAKLSVALKDASGKVVATQSKTTTIPAGKLVDVACELPVSNANLWTSETPYLYSLETALDIDGKRVSTTSAKTGLRTVETKGNLLLVNGSPVKLFAVCRHEVHPLRGRSLTPELCREDARLYKAGNANTVRTSHYPPSEEFLDACDEIGLFVECEAAVCWVAHGASPVWQRWNYRDPAYFPYLLRPSLDMIAAYRNHPSIVIWSMGNESKWSNLWAKVLQVVKRHETMRPIAFHDQCWGGYNNAGSTSVDIANYHYPSENTPEVWSAEPRPVWFGEYAHLQCYNRRELATDPGIQEDWGRPLQRMVDLMWDQPGCLGGAIWSGIDDVFHLPDGNLCGYGHWGPIDAWRREKPEYHGMRMAYTPFRVFSAQAEEGKPLVLSVQNRQNFLNLDRNTITWQMKARKGQVKSNLAPHAKGEIRINENFKQGDVVTLSVKNPAGQEIAREVITITGKNKSADRVASVSKPLALAFDPGKNSFTLPGGMELALPVPMVLELNGSGGATGPAGSTLANEIEPFTPVRDWAWTRDSSSGKEIKFTGEGSQGKGELGIQKQQDGKFLIRYKVTLAEDINPRQWGIVFSLPQDFDTIEWDRNAHWSWYPEDQLGRAKGKTKAAPVNRKYVEEPGVEPKNVWKDDSNALGTKDFRATKIDIQKAMLINSGNGQAVTFMPVAEAADKPQSVRAWVADNRINVLVAGFNTGGADGFFSTHYSAERRPLKQGDTIESEFLFGGEQATRQQ